MNIYLITRTEHEYDEYDGFVVAANSSEEALDYVEKNYNNNEIWSPWPNVGVKSAREIGDTKEYKDTTIILESFNAG